VRVDGTVSRGVAEVVVGWFWLGRGWSGTRGIVQKHNAREDADAGGGRPVPSRTASHEARLLDIRHTERAFAFCRW
jgi:hypothetical protein